MTVSPRRAQDGQHLPSDLHQSSDRSSYDMPPTLFKLPHLNPTSHAHADWDQPAPAVPNEPVEANVPVATAASASVANAANQTDPTGNGMQAPPVVSPSQSTPQAPPTGELGPSSTNAANDSHPMGRTWMERVGSHTLILSMLLIVVAAAVLTGRNTGDPAESDDAVAASVGKEIQFDAQGQVELPIPDHLHLSESLEVANDHSPPMSAVDYADPGVIEPYALDGERTITQKLAFDRRPAANPAEEFVATQSRSTALSEPQRNRDDSLASTYENSDAAAVSKPGPHVESSQPHDGSMSVGATTVSNRTVLEDEALAVPTLEDLESSAVMMCETRRFDGPSFSRTPFGLSDSDLFLHLDEMIQRSSTPVTRNAASRKATSR